MQQTDTAPAEKLDFKKILPIFVIVLVDLLGLTIIIPLLPLYATSFGADPFTIGLLGTAYPLMQLVGAPFLGSLSDRFGRRPILIVSQIGTFIGFVLLGFANALPILFLSRLLDGLSGANIVAAQAAIADVTTEKTRTQGLGLIGAAFGLGFTLGPAIAGISLALSGNNFHVPAFIAAGFSLASIGLTTFVFKETLTPERRTSNAQGKTQGNFVQRLMRAINNPIVGILLLLMFMQQLIFGGYENLFALFSLSRLGLSASGNALLFLFIGIILVFVQGYYIGKWSQRFGERKLIFAGLTLLGIGLFLTAITPSQPVPWYNRAETIQQITANSNNSTTTIAIELPSDANLGWTGFIWIIIACVPTSIGAGILSPSINSLMTKRVNPSEMGSTLGVSSSLVSLANAITPILGGTIFQILGSTAPFLMGGILLGVLFVWSVRVIKPANDAVSVGTNAPATS